MNWKDIHKKFPSGEGYFSFEKIDYLGIYHYPSAEFYKSNSGYGISEKGVRQFFNDYDPEWYGFVFKILTFGQLLNRFPPDKFLVLEENAKKFLAKAYYWSLNNGDTK